MRLRRISLGRAMIVISVIAADCGLLREYVQGLNSTFPEGGPAMLRSSGAFLMVNILAIGLCLLASRPRGSRPFLSGFVAAGFVALVAFYVGSYLFLDASLVDRLFDWLEPITQFYTYYVVDLLYVSLVAGLPLLCMAVLGGLVARLFARPERPNESDTGLETMIHERGVPVTRRG